MRLGRNIYICSNYLFIKNFILKQNYYVNWDAEYYADVTEI